MPEEKKDIEKIIDSLSPNERKIINFIHLKNFEELKKKSDLSYAAIMRSLEFLSNKNIIKINIRKEKIIDLGVNGILYLKKGLPERTLINLIIQKNSISLSDAKKTSSLSDNEFAAALGVLKKKLFIDLKDKMIILNSKKQEIIKKTIEEKFLENLPKPFEELSPEENYAFNNLKSRKNLVILKYKSLVDFPLTNLGEKITKENLDISSKMIEGVTSEIIKNSLWKNKKFRRYDIQSKVPEISGGKIYFVEQVIDYAKRIWTEMGFKEMTGDLIQPSFWNFDALFTPQDHPVREMQDSFFIKNNNSNLSEEKIQENIINKIKKSHEGGVNGSKGWQYNWDKNIAQKNLLRTHTTCLSIKKLFEIAKNKEFPAKYFAIGKCFRNETVDWSHGFEFNQTEGIVVDENANFRQLLGYLKEFFKKMGYEKIRIRPGYFPYTEPSLEIDVFHKEQKKWIEFGGAGIFRPEVVIPIFRRYIPVLAWGPGLDRMIMEFFNIKDLRKMYENNFTDLRKMKIWRK